MLRFYLKKNQSPTYYNLSRHLKAQGWSSTRFSWRADFSHQNFQYYTLAAECLEFKHLLAQLVAQHCPDVMPTTYSINDENWPFVLNQATEKHPHLIWILKPALLNNGQHIKIFQNLDQVKQHYRSSNRLGGEHVLQEYITNPHLLKGPEKGHKYSIRMFAILTNYAGAYLYPKGYFNVALRSYEENEFISLSAHLTNEHLKEDVFNVVQVPTEQYDLFKPLYPKIKTILDNVINGLKESYPDAFLLKKKRTLAIFGFDFIVDHEQRVWLLEANHGPCFPTDNGHPLQKKVYEDFWEAVIANFILPIAMRQTVEGNLCPLFEVISV